MVQQLLQQNFHHVRQCMKNQANKRRMEQTFFLGEVFYQTTTLHAALCHALF
jgi:hypothetical protein